MFGALGFTQAWQKDYKDQLPFIPPKTPQDSLKAFKTRPGFKIDLIASEPLIGSPVAMDFDENANLYVAEYPEYNAYATLILNSRAVSSFFKIPTTMASTIKVPSSRITSRTLHLSFATMVASSLALLLTSGFSKTPTTMVKPTLGKKFSQGLAETMLAKQCSTLSLGA
jgi:hypothetical protein